MVAMGAMYGRPWMALYGAQSAYPAATLVVRLESAPTGPAALTLTGLDDEWPALNPLTMTVNDQVVFSGPSPFANWDGSGNSAAVAWTPVTLAIPAELLHAGRNTITVANLTPSSAFNAPPYVLLAETVLTLPGATIAP
jgi:hypothetical protein